MLHTGQHYDPELSQVFFDELGLGEPRYRLEVGGLGRERDAGSAAPGSSTRSRRAAGLGARLRRHELDARRRAGGRRGRRPARARRGRAAQLRPLDAGGAQPDRDRPALAAPLRPGRALARERSRPRASPDGSRCRRRDGGRLLRGSRRSRASDRRFWSGSESSPAGTSSPPCTARQTWRSRGWADPRGSRPHRGAASSSRRTRGREPRSQRLRTSSIAADRSRSATSTSPRSRRRRA